MLGWLFRRHFNAADCWALKQTAVDLTLSLTIKRLLF